MSGNGIESIACNPLSTVMSPSPHITHNSEPPLQPSPHQSSPINRHIRPIQPTSRMSLTRADGMDVSNLSLLHPKRMTIRRRFLARAIQAWEADVNVHDASFDVDYVAAIDELDG